MAGAWRSAQASWTGPRQRTPRVSWARRMSSARGAPAARHPGARRQTRNNPVSPEQARHGSSERRDSYTCVRTHTRQSMQLAVPEDASIREQGRQEVSNITINITMPDGSAQTVEVGRHTHPHPRKHTTPARTRTSTGVPTHSCCEKMTRRYVRPHIRIMHACTLTCVHERTHERTDSRAQLRMYTRGILQVDAGQTVEYVRAYLHEHFGVPFNGSTLQFQGRTLIDPMSLSDFGGIICACVSVYAYVRGRDYIHAL